MSFVAKAPPHLNLRSGAELTGFEEVPAILTRGAGHFQARLIDDGTALEYQLSYGDLSALVTAAHIHFGRKGTNGAILVFLCGGDDAPACPIGGGTVAGVITGNDVRAIPEQGVNAGDFSGLVQILRSGMAYVNVHTINFPSGEIRGQVR